MKTNAGSILITFMAVAILALVLLSWAFCGSVFAEIPRREVARDTVATVEVNDVYSEGGCLNFTQLVWRDDGNVVIAWRMCKPGMQPRRDWQNGGYVVAWIDGGILREVRAEHLRETTGVGHDTEADQRAIVPQDQRRELTNPAYWITESEWRNARRKWEGIR